MKNQSSERFDYSKFMFITCVYLLCLGLVLGIQNKSFVGIGIEVYNLSKLIFVLLLAYYVQRNWVFFYSRADEIMKVNFIIFSLNLFFSFVTGLGLDTYGNIETATKGFLYGGNAASVLSIVFFSYYLFKWEDDFKSKIFTLIGFLNIYIVGTKVIFITPLILVLYFLLKIKWNAKRIAWTGILITPFLIYFGILIKPVVIEIFNNRYLSTLKRAGLYSSNGGGAFNEIILAYRRIEYVIEQTAYQISNFFISLFGIGRVGQMNFWELRNGSFDFAAMDFFDLIFQYGLIGGLLVFYFFFQALKKAWKIGISNPLSIAFFLILAYSFFGGYVLYSATAGTFLSFLTGIHLKGHPIQHS